MILFHIFSPSLSFVRSNRARICFQFLQISQHWLRCLCVLRRNRWELSFNIIIPNIAFPCNWNVITCNRHFACCLSVLRDRRAILRSSWSTLQVWKRWVDDEDDDTIHLGWGKKKWNWIFHFDMPTSALLLSLESLKNLRDFCSVLVNFKILVSSGFRWKEKWPWLIDSRY